ncbi:MAG: hypothetical protein ACKVVP_16390 [Chloroflexota bacterium]
MKAKTGRTWAEWFALLDADGANQWEHKRIASHLLEHYDASGWWSQTVTVEYERERGLRDKYQKTDGYSASGSRTIGVPVDVLYEAVANGEQRTAWLGELELTIRKATPSRSVRLTVADGTNLDVMFYAKGEGRAQITLQHDKLPDAETTARMKAFWSEALDRLKTGLAGA